MGYPAILQPRVMRGNRGFIFCHGSSPPTHPRPAGTLPLRDRRTCLRCFHVIGRHPLSTPPHTWLRFGGYPGFFFSFCQEMRTEMHSRIPLQQIFHRDYSRSVSHIVSTYPSTHFHSHSSILDTSSSLYTSLFGCRYDRNLARCTRVRSLISQDSPKTCPPSHPRFSKLTRPLSVQSHTPVSRRHPLI